MSKDPPPPRNYLVCIGIRSVPQGDRNGININPRISAIFFDVVTPVSECIMILNSNNVEED